MKTRIEKKCAQVMDRFNSAANTRKNVEKSWNDAYRAYIGINNSKDEPYFIPETFTTTETILTRIASPFMNRTKPVVSFEGRQPEDHARAQSIEELIQYQFERARIADKISDFFRQALIYKNAIAKTYWRESHEEVETLVQVPRTDEFGILTMENELVSEKRKVYDDPELEIVPIYDFFIDPAATGINDREPARFVIQKKIYSREDIEELKENGWFNNTAEIDRLLKDLPEGTAEETGAKKIDIEQTGYKNVGPGEGIKAKYNGLEYWTNHEVLVVIEENYLVKEEKNPHGHIPYVYSVFSELPFQFYGLSIHDIIGSLQKIVNRIANLRLKNVALSVNGMFFRKPGAVDDSQLVSRPGGVIDVLSDDIDRALKLVQFPDVTQSAYKEQEIAQQGIQNATAVTDYIRGMASDVSPKQTATEVERKTQAAGTRFTFIFNQMTRAVVDIARHFLKMSQKMITDEKVIKIVGARGAIQYKTITAQDIQGEYDIVIAVDPMRSDEQQRMQNTLGFTDRVLNPVFLENIDRLKLLEELAGVFKVDPDIIIQQGDFYGIPGSPGPVPGGYGDFTAMPGVEGPPVTGP